MTREVESEETAVLRERVRELEQNNAMLRQLNNDQSDERADAIAAFEAMSRARIAALDDAIAKEEERDAAQRALAESQARERELRKALGTLAVYPDHPEACYCETCSASRVAKLVVARPSDQTALREFGLKVANLAAENSPPMAPAEVVDAVLKGAP